MGKSQQKLLKDFTAYCKAHPDQRFWQALRNWAGVDMVLIEDAGVYDTFFWTDEEALEYIKKTKTQTKTKG